MKPNMKKTLDFVTEFLARTGGVSPSLDEIAAAIGLKTRSSASRCVLALIADGRLVRTKGRRRSIALAQSRCPLCRALKPTAETP